MTTHRIKATLIGYFKIDDEDLQDVYQSSNIHEAIIKQREWLETDGDIMEFVRFMADPITLTFEIVIPSECEDCGTAIPTGDRYCGPGPRATMQYDDADEGFPA